MQQERREHSDENKPSLDSRLISPARDRSLALCVGLRRGADANPVMLISSATLAQTHTTTTATATACVLAWWCDGADTFIAAWLSRHNVTQESLVQSMNALQRVLGLGFFMEEASRRLATVIERQRQREATAAAAAVASAVTATAAGAGTAVA